MRVILGLIKDCRKEELVELSDLVDIGEENCSLFMSDYFPTDEASFEVGNNDAEVSNILLFCIDKFCNQVFAFEEVFS